MIGFKGASYLGKFIGPPAVGQRLTAAAQESFSPTAAIRGLAISADGTFLASVGDDNTLILWNLPRILNLDALAYGCALVRDYLRTNQEVEREHLSFAKIQRHWGQGGQGG